MATSNIDQRAPLDDAPHPADERSESRALVEYEQKGVSQTNEAGASHLAARSAKEVEARAIMAVNRPRDMARFRLRVLESCRRPLFAAGREEGKGAIYRRKVGGNKVATGLSIRAAEECARLYGNLDIRAILISEDDHRRTFESCAVDLETNAWYTVPVVVPKTVWRKDPKGQRVLGAKQNSRNETTYLVEADDDSLLVLQANMLAKAQREVVLKLIPSDIKEEMYDVCMETIKGEVKRDPTVARKRLLDAFYNRGVMPAQVAELLGHPVDVMTEAEIVMLKEYGTAMAEEGLSWAEVTQAHGVVTGDAPPTKAHAKGAEGLKAKLGATKPQATPAPDASGSTCSTCGMTGGKHDPNCPQYADD